MADRFTKKYIAKVERTVYNVETLEIIADSEREAEELLDNYVTDGEVSEVVKYVSTATQETEVDSQWIESSEELGVDEFMELN